MTARTWPAIPLSEAERSALLRLAFLVRMGVGIFRPDPALAARIGRRASLI